MAREDAGFEGPHAGNTAEAIAHQDVVFKDTFPGMLGVKILTATRDGATATMDVGPNTKHPGGYAHGGAIAGFGDTIAAWATFPGLQEGQAFTTIEFKTNFITGVASGTLLGEASVVHRGRRTIVLDVKITCDDRLVAMMIVTQAVLGEPKNAGREVSPE